jgi:hypothetical protein
MEGAHRMNVATAYMSLGNGSVSIGAHSHAVQPPKVEELLQSMKAVHSITIHFD